MRSFLHQPYPFSEDVSKKLLVCGGIGLFVAFFLILFEPFGLEELSTDVKWKHALLFGAVTFLLSSFCQILLPKIFPNAFREEGWRSWKEILFLLITTAFIGAGNYGTMLCLYPQNMALANFFRAELITLQVGIFPICFVVFMKQMLLYRRFVVEAKEVTEDIQGEAESLELPSPVHPRQIILRGDNQKEEISILPEELLFISSADNYVRIQYVQEGAQKSILLRSTLKKMEEQLAGFVFFFRCHRMYLVNLKLVTSVSGNAQGLKLHIPALEDAIPVSRSLTETVKEKLHHLSHSPQNA